MKNILIGTGTVVLNVAVFTAGYLGILTIGDKIEARRKCEVNEEKLWYGQVGDINTYNKELAKAVAV